MKKTAKIITFVTFSLFAQVATSGPFGLKMGMSIKQIDTTAEQAAPGLFSTKKVPKPHSAFSLYAVKVAPKSGLCWIKAVGKDISTSSYGHELKSEFETMEGKLTYTYGSGEKIDLLLAGSIWKEPNDFMMGMVKKERFLMTSWKKDKVSKMKGDLDIVILTASPDGISNGYLSVEYYFSNKGECDKEIASQEDDAL